MNNVILSLKMVFLYIIHGDKLEAFLRKSCLFEEYGFLIPKLKKISFIIVAVCPITLMFIFNKVELKDYLVELIGINSRGVTDIISFFVVIILVLILDIIVSFSYVFKVVSKHETKSISGRFCD
ncbi:MAG: hypothetical protein E7547_05715 [Ruminococcaceae bacterium]|nr:hypothetical protein [Oscillospiraceae bacterium]